MKKILISLILALSLGSVVFAEEPAKAPAAPGAPAVSVPAVATDDQKAAAPAAMQAVQAPAVAPAANQVEPPTTIKANPKVTIPIFLMIIGCTLGVVIWSARKT